MPKIRKFGREIKKRVFIVCEGSKTEPNYFRALIEDCNFKGRPIEIFIVNTHRNTPKELVLDANNLKELSIDEAWVVFDRDGYTKHREAFRFAEEYQVNIAFSSISFEIWILLHFMFFKSNFADSGAVIEFMKRKKLLSYRKNDKYTYQKIKHLTDTAIKNATRLRNSQFKKFPLKEFYEFNPITNVDLLVKEIRNLKKLYY
ncbi:MAG: RloB family protein [Candidatus Kapaibacteriota bacterium]|jgi:hypothetical protein